MSADSTVAHTPGRWEARPTKNAEWEVVQPDPTAIDGIWYVAEVFDCVDGESAESVARLIAAAPELLEALEQDVGAIRHAIAAIKSGDHNRIGKLIEALELRHTASRTAIAKAKGQDHA